MLLIATLTRRLFELEHVPEEVQNSPTYKQLSTWTHLIYIIRAREKKKKRTWHLLLVLSCEEPTCERASEALRSADTSYTSATQHYRLVQSQIMFQSVLHKCYTTFEFYNFL